MTIDEYLDDIQPEQKAEIERLMALVRKHVPEATEQIAYGMPAFKYKKQPLIYFGAFKEHMSVFPTPGPTTDEAMLKKLEGFKVSKGTVQFTLEKPLPDEIVIDILDHRIRAINAT